MTMDYRDDQEPDPPPKGLPELIVWALVLWVVVVAIVPLLEGWGKHEPYQVEPAEETPAGDWITRWLE